MKALTVLQPWASLLIGGKKRFETRGWKTPYRGPLLIHAGKRFPKELQLIAASDPFKHALRNLGFTDPSQLYLGAILGKVELDDILTTESFLREITHDQIEVAFGDYSPKRFAWSFIHPTPLVIPVPYIGLRGLFDIPDNFALDHLNPLLSPIQIP